MSPPKNDGQIRTFMFADSRAPCHRTLQREPLSALVNALLAEVVRDGRVTLDTASTERGEPGASDPDNIRDHGYDPSAVYVLEFCTILASRDVASATAVARHVIDVLMQILRNPSQFHHIVVARTAFYALNLLHATYVSARAILPLSRSTNLTGPGPSICERAYTSPYHHSLRVGSARQVVSFYSPGNPPLCAGTWAVAERDDDVPRLLGHFEDSLPRIRCGSIGV